MANVRTLVPLSSGWLVMDVDKIGDHIVNRCLCGSNYTLNEFKQLDYVGCLNIGEYDGIEPSIVEHRNCRKCGSTRSIWYTSAGDYCEEIVE